MAEETKPNVDYIKELKKYQHAIVSGSLPSDPQFKVHALSAMESFYKQFGMDKDPAVQRMFMDTSRSLQAGQGYSADFAQAIGVYSEKYKKAFTDSKIGDLVKYFTESGVKDLPTGITDLLTKYEGKTPAELVKELKADKEKKENQKVLQALELIQRQLIEGSLLSKLISTSVTRQTKQGLEGLLSGADEEE